MTNTVLKIIYLKNPYRMQTKLIKIWNFVCADVHAALLFLQDDQTRHADLRWVENIKPILYYLICSNKWS